MTASDNVGNYTEKMRIDSSGVAVNLTNKLLIDEVYSGFSSTTNAEISNDTGTYKTLMILGNTSGGGGLRRVSLWDQLTVNGNLITTGNVNAATFTGNGAGITNVTAANVPWSGVTSVPAFGANNVSGRVRMADVGCGASWASSCDPGNTGYPNFANSVNATSIINNGVAPINITGTAGTATNTNGTGNIPYIGGNDGTYDYLYTGIPAAFNVRVAKADRADELLGSPACRADGTNCPAAPDRVQWNDPSNRLSIDGGINNANVHYADFSGSAQQVGTPNGGWVADQSGVGGFQIQWQQVADSSVYFQNLGTTVFQFDVSGGNAFKNGGGSWSGFSDRRLKKDIQTYSDGLSLIDQVKPVTFKYNGLGGTADDGKEYVGIIAQELEKIAPYMISVRKKKLSSEDSEETDLRAVDPSAFTYMLVNAVHELSDKSKLQQKQIDALTAEIEGLKQQPGK